jgi:hypothetical protein
MSSIQITNGEELLTHYGHKIEIVTYGRGEEIQNISIECVECYEVLGDQDTDDD